MTYFIIGFIAGIVITEGVVLFINSRRKPIQVVDVPPIPKFRPPSESKTALEIHRQKEQEHLASLKAQKLADDLNKKFRGLNQM